VHVLEAPVAKNLVLLQVWQFEAVDVQLTQIASHGLHDGTVWALWAKNVPVVQAIHVLAALSNLKSWLHLVQAFAAPRQPAQILLQVPLQFVVSVWPSIELNVPSVH
jgi:hypothetical protein